MFSGCGGSFELDDEVGCLGDDSKRGMDYCKRLFVRKRGRGEYFQVEADSLIRVVKWGG